MAQANRTCLVCGKKYDYCPKCGRGSWDKKYMFVYCSENCYGIDSILMKYRSDYNLITKEDATEQLKNFDLSKRDNYSPLIKKDVDEILAYEEENNELITNESSEDIVTTSELSLENGDEKVEEVKRTRRKRRSSKKSVSSDQNISE